MWATRFLARTATLSALRALPALGALGTLGGCASSAVIAAAGVTAGFGLAQGQAEAFIRGNLTAARLVTLDQALDAVLAAMAELQVEVRTLRRDEQDAYVRAKAEQGREIKTKIEMDSPTIAKFEIRVGIMGDQSVSRLVMARIDYHLGIQSPMVPVEQSPIVAPPPPSPPDAAAADERGRANP